MKSEDHPSLDLSTHLAPLYRIALTELTRDWRGSKRFPHVGPHPLEDVARACVASVVQTAPDVPANTPLEPLVLAHLDPSLFRCCEEDEAIRWYWTHAETEYAVRRRFIHGDRAPGSSYREMMDQACDEAMRRQDRGLHIVQKYRQKLETLQSQTPPPEAPPFLAYLRQSLENTVIDLIRTKRHGDDFWRVMTSLEPPADDQRPAPRIVVDESNWGDAFRWLMRQSRSEAACRVLTLLEGEVQNIAHPVRRARLQAWLSWMHQSDSVQAPTPPLPTTRKELANMLGCSENTLGVDIFRFRESFMKKYADEVRRALTLSVGA